MPVTRFRVRWPDEVEALYYSPSSIVTEHFDAGATYDLPEFLHRVRSALTEASERVRRKYGYACSAAEDELEVIENYATRFVGQSEVSVKVVGFHH